jgi:S-adenosylmethionine-diacylglycerol 3-amino-3-carboxypropyl transferase
MTTTDDRLMYAQNWEDPCLELAALDIHSDDEVIAIAGAGCTVLSLLAKGPRRLHAVDRSAAQIHLLHLKLAAARCLPGRRATEFLGGVPGNHRLETFDSLQDSLPAQTGLFWNGRREQIRRGVISQGRIERYFAFLRRLLRLVHSQRRIDELFTQPTIDAQRRFFRDRWDTAGWRGVFLLAHKWILDRALDPSFYRFVDARDLPHELRQRAARCLTEVPTRNNYFLSWILRGRYPEDAEGRPPYLRCAAARALEQYAYRLDTHHTDIRVFLRSRSDSSCDKFYLSNVSEWLREDDVATFFEEIIRVARDGATVCYRALMLDRPLPATLAGRLVEDPARSAQLAASDRAFVNAGFHVVTVRKHAGQ